MITIPKGIIPDTTTSVSLTSTSNINTRINTGTLYQQKGDYRTAIKAYESVLILYPNNINANLYRAQCYDKLGDSKIAQEAFKKVIALDPNNDYVKYQMIDNAKKTMEPEQFVTFVNTNMTTMNPAEIIYNYAIDLHKNGKLENAINMYNEALKLDTKNPEIYVNIALAQAQGNKYGEALKTLSLAKTKFPQNPTIISTEKNIITMQNDSKLAKAAEAYNNKNYKEAIYLDKMAYDLGVSKYVLSRLFSKTFHCNFPGYVNGVRLNYAISMLEGTQETITNICYDCGFESQRTFNRVFKDRYRVTPREYRTKRHILEIH